MILKNAFSQPLDASICSTNLVMVQECKFVAKPNFLNKEANFTINNTNIWVNLGCFSGISCCERRNFDMMKSMQLSFVDFFTASRRFGQRIPELFP